MDTAMRLMADRGVGALPVVEGRRVVGILTQSDVVTAVARMEPR
jgi:CBS domain-containing protein